MLTILGAVADLGPSSAPRPGRATALDRQLERWAGDRSGRADIPAAALRLSVLTRTRLHGVVSLEIEGVFESMKVDPALLFEAEVDELIRSAQR